MAIFQVWNTHATQGASTECLQCLPGAMVLAHSLRDNGTQKKLAAMVTTDSVSAATIEELRVCTYANCRRD